MALMPTRSPAKTPGMKTKRTDEDVADYIASLESETTSGIR